MISKKKKMKAINDYVKRERKKRSVKDLSPSYLPELSCFDIGEFKNLVERQLIYTKKSKELVNGWKELADPEILNGAYLFVTKGIRGG